MTEYPQTVSNLTEIGQNLYDLIEYRNILLYPCKDLRFEATCAIGKETGRGLRIVKEKSSQKIDQIVALAMASIDAVKKSDLLFPRPRCNVTGGDSCDAVGEDGETSIGALSANN